MDVQPGRSGAGAPLRRIAIVTGGNRGIGLEICRQLAEKGVCVILAARDSDKGRAAAEKLREKGYDVHFFQLDITDPEQIITVLARIKAEFNRLDILVNNAGIYIDQHTSALSINSRMILRAVETDVCGTFSMSQAVIPLMRENNYGRSLYHSSSSSLLANMNDDVGLSYKIYKTSNNGLKVVLSKAVAGSNILINAATPGWVRTSMGGGQAPLSLPEGADTPVWLATLPDDGPSGGFFFKRKQLPW